MLADVADPGYSTVNPSGHKLQHEYWGNLDLATDYANVILNGNSLVFNTSGKISNYSRDRMMVTGNSIAGHMVKDYAGSESFVFPVGIAEEDYTPATLAALSPGRLFVSVQDSQGANRLKMRLLVWTGCGIFSELPLLV